MSASLMPAFGAIPVDDERVEFRVWAPALRAGRGPRSRARPPARPRRRRRPRRDRRGVGRATTTSSCSTAGRRCPTRARASSRDGVRGPSRVVDTSRLRIAPGPELPLEELVLYELHVGTFTPGGTFDAVIPHLERLRSLGVTALELMPVATFPGERGWGYDGVYTYAPHRRVRRPGGARAPRRRRASRGARASCSTSSTTTSGPGPRRSARSARTSPTGTNLLGRRDRLLAARRARVGDPERDHVDARLPHRRPAARRGARDLRRRITRARPARAARRGSTGLVISEMGHDDFRPLEEWGHDAMWLDNLHHELHVLLTGERDGYYAAFGSIDGVVRELTRPAPERLVVAAQNHDQIGNRALGDRLPPEAHRVALAIVLFSLSTPLLFMGEEHDERAPFQFFTDHIDPLIAEATREGRKREFAAFSAFAGTEPPDPQAASTFERSRISHRSSRTRCTPSSSGCVATLPRRARSGRRRPRADAPARRRDPRRRLRRADRGALAREPPRLAGAGVSARSGMGRRRDELLALLRERRARRALPLRRARGGGAHRAATSGRRSTGTATSRASARASTTATASTGRTTRRPAGGSTPRSC